MPIPRRDFLFQLGLVSSAAMHRNFSVYITTASASVWNLKGKVDHDITRVVSGISDTAYVPEKAAVEVVGIIESMLKAG